MDSQVSRKTEGSVSDPTNKGVSLIKHTKEKQRSPCTQTTGGPDTSEEKQRSPCTQTTGGPDTFEEKQRSPCTQTTGGPDDSENKGSLIKHSKAKEGSPGALTAESHDNFSAKAKSSRGVSKMRSQDDSAKTGWAKLGNHATTKKLDSKKSSRLPCSQVGTGWGRFGIQSQARHDPYFGMQHAEGKFREEMANAITSMLPLMGNRMGELIAISFHNSSAEKLGKFGGGAVCGSSELADYAFY
jgi:hypothetical protein